VIAGLNERSLPPVALMPNPAADHVTLTGLEGDAGDLSIFDLGGRRVLWQQLVRGAPQATVDVRSLASGTYQVLVTTDRGTRSGKLVVMR